jgi:hypothetical protein
MKLRKLITENDNFMKKVLFEDLPEKIKNKIKVLKNELKLNDLEEYNIYFYPTLKKYQIEIPCYNLAIRTGTNSIQVLSISYLTKNIVKEIADNANNKDILPEICQKLLKNGICSRVPYMTTYPLIPSKEILTFDFEM